MKHRITLLLALISWLPLAAADLQTTKFADASVVPSPACLCASADGHVFVGVDLNGSLGKGPEKGRIVKLIDKDADGVSDSHTIFAKVDNPRGLFALGNQLFVLHTVYPAGAKQMSGMHLSVFTDADEDGIADGPYKILVKNISTLKHNRARGADHTTNGIRMGIDGWIYIAVGDFGYVDAEGTDGTKLTLLGGGVLRVRPDGTEMELYTKGLRNIYDVAIDPFMNIYTRGNTNDGGGWNVRFIHHVQSGNYGYPMLFKRFTNEILPALADVGGGSGTGAVYFQEPSWPADYNNVPLMADWGRSHLYIHRVTPDGPSFTQKQENYIKCSQISDVDVDAHGQLFVSAWDGAGYKGNPGKGYVERIVPKNWQRQAFTKPIKLSDRELIKDLSSASSTARLHISQELVRRKLADTKPLIELATNTDAKLESRVAAIFTFAQIAGVGGTAELIKLSQDQTIREWALRAATDRKPWAKSAPLAPFQKALSDNTQPRVQVAAAVSLGRIGNSDAAATLLTVANPPAVDKSESKTAHWTSATITGDQTVQIDVDISAYKELHLIVDPVDKIDNDNIAWVNPRIINSDGKINDLTKLKFKSKQGWGKTLVNKDSSEEPLLDQAGKKLVGIGSHAHSVISFKIPNKRTVSRFQATGVLTKRSGGNGAVKFIVSPTPKLAGAEGPHATPNAATILPHVAVTALRECNAVDQCVTAINSPQSEGALWALNQMYTSATVDGLIDQFQKAEPKVKNNIITTLARLYHREADYDGSWWWSTRPDTRGPYYVPKTWASSDKIESFLREKHKASNTKGKELIAQAATYNRLNLKGLGEVEVVSEAESKKGELGRTSIEDVVLSLDKLKGNKKKGREVLNKLACAACHNLEKGQLIKGPDLAALGKQSLADIAESIIKPEATIAKSWVSITKNDGSVLAGTIVSQTKTEVLLHNIAGIPTKIPTTDIKSTLPGPPLMGPHLADQLTLQEFANLVLYLQKMGK